MNNSDKIIAITGYGSISALGSDKETILKNYLTNKSFFTKKKINNKEYYVSCLTRETEEELNKLICSDNKLKKIDRTAILAIIAANKAFADAEWGNKNNLTGVNIGSSRGATTIWEKYHEEFIKTGKTNLLTSPLTTLGNISSSVANYLCLTGPCISHSVTCSTGIQSIANSIAWLKAGMASKFLAGASEAPLTKFTLAQLESLGIYSKLNNNEYPCQPLSFKENTMTLGEGAAVFAIEKIKINELKNKKVYAIIESVGYGFEKKPSHTGISENGKNLQQSMSMALKNCISKNEIDLILLHAPGTLHGDKAEIAAIKQIFKKNIPNLYSNKLNIGHTYAASGMLNLELAILILQNNFSPKFPYPTPVNNNNNNKINKILINAAGFGGNAGSLIISNAEII